MMVSRKITQDASKAASNKQTYDGDSPLEMQMKLKAIEKVLGDDYDDDGMPVLFPDMVRRIRKIMNSRLMDGSLCIVEKIDE